MFAKSKENKRKSRGASTLEYMILVAAVVSVLIATLGKNGLFTKALTRTYSMSTTSMEDMASRLSASHTTLAETGTSLGNTTLPY